MAGPSPAGLLYWYTTSGILGLLTFINLASISAGYIAKQRYERSRRARPSPSLPIRQVGSTAAPPYGGSDMEKCVPAPARDKDPRRRGVTRGVRTFRAAETAWKKHVLLLEIPLPYVPWVKRRLQSIVATELAWSLGYTAGVLAISLYGSELPFSHGTRDVY
jgi:hypothetical protein